MTVEVKMNEFNIISGGINTAYHEASRRVGLSDAESQILYTIANRGDGCPQSDLYKLIGTGRSTINSAVKRMEKKHWIYLAARDGRSTDVFLTEEGKALSERTIEKIIQIENKIYDSWTDQERQIFVALNRRFMEKLKEEVKNL